MNRAERLQSFCLRLKNLGLIKYLRHPILCGIAYRDWGGECILFRYAETDLLEKRSNGRGIGLLPPPYSFIYRRNSFIVGLYVAF